jgi:glycosyltransferase involved in cell wall biosynthesis
MTRRRAGRDFAHWVAGSVLLAAIAALVAPLGRLRSVLRRRRGKLPAILAAPTPLITLRYVSLGDQLYGYDSETLVYDVYSINAPADFDRVVNLTSRSALVRLTAPYVLLAWAILRYDLFSFFFDGGLLCHTPLWRWELPLLKFAGKKIVVYPYGGDARLPSRTRALGRWNAYTDVPPGEEDRDEHDVARRLQAFGRWADAVLGCADLVEDLPRVDGIFLYPLDVDAWPPREEADDGVVTIVHSPNHRHYKGTRFLIAAVERLRSEQLPVELVLVEGMRNDVARDIYERADIIADQFLIGAYALFAIEGMALGKPVVCYLNDHFDRWHPEWAECPIVSASPDELADRLRDLVVNPALRRELGRRGIDFARRYHSVQSVGARMDVVYRRVWFGGARETSARQ